jgi:hypothetical protein
VGWFGSLQAELHHPSVINSFYYIFGGAINDKFSTGVPMRKPSGTYTKSVDMTISAKTVILSAVVLTLNFVFFNVRPF